VAKGYRAVTTIKHGAEGGGSAKIFKPGDKVEGLDKDEMRQLWEAGALEEYESTGDDEGKVTAVKVPDSQESATDTAVVERLGETVDVNESGDEDSEGGDVTEGAGTVTETEVAPKPEEAPKSEAKTTPLKTAPAKAAPTKAAPTKAGSPSGESTS